MDWKALLKALPSPIQHAIILMVLGGGIGLGWSHFDDQVHAASQTAADARSRIATIDARLHDIEQKQTTTDQKLDDLKEEQAIHNQLIDQQLNRIEQLLEDDPRRNQPSPR